MNSNVKHMPDTMGKLLEDLLAQYHAGKLQGILIGVLEKDTTVQSYWSGLTYLQRMGVAGNLLTGIAHIQRHPNE